MQVISMACHDEDYAPFIRFTNAASREQDHDYKNLGFCCERVFVVHKWRKRIPHFMLIWWSLGGFR